MIKNCIMYQIDEKYRNSISVQNEPISKVTLEDCLEKSDSLHKRRISSLIKLAKNEEIALSDKIGDAIVFNANCEFKARKLIASGTSPFVSTSHKVWLREKFGTIISFDAGKKLAAVGNIMISIALFGTPTAINSLKIKKENFHSFVDWLLKSNRGEINRINLRDLEYGGTKFKQIILSGSQLHNSDLFHELFGSANLIKDIGFKSPELRSSKRVISCRITNWGGIVFYTPNMFDVEINEMITNFETYLLKI